MASRLLPSGSEEQLSRTGHPILFCQSPSAVSSDTAFVPSDTSELSYEQLIGKQHHDDKFVNLMELDPAFLAPEICFSPQMSHTASHEFDIRSLLRTSPDQLMSFQFHDDASYDACVSDTRFSSYTTSSQINASLLQQQQPYASLNRERHQATPVVNNEYTGLPSLPLLSNPSGEDTDMNMISSQLYIPFELECSGNSASASSSLLPCQYDVYTFGDNMQLNPSRTGFPSFQILPPPPQTDHDLALSSNPLRSLPPLNVSGMNACCPSDSTVYLKNQSSMQNNFTSNSVQLVPLASHHLQSCSIPMCNAVLLPPSRVSSIRTQGHDVHESARKIRAESPISDTIRALEGYRKTQVGLSNVPSCQDGKGACQRADISGGIAHSDPCRKHGRLGNRGHPPARTDEPHLPKFLKDLTQVLKRKETKTRKSQSQIELNSVKGPLISCRKRRARKSVERKLNEAILIFNNMESVYVEGREAITEKAITFGLPTDNRTEPCTISNFDLGAESGTKCPEDNVDCTLKSQKFSEYDRTKEDKLDIKRADNASPALEVATSVSGNIFNETLVSYSPATSGFKDASAVECTENINTELQRDEVPLDCTFHENAKVVTGVDESRKEFKGEGSSKHKLTSFYTRNPRTAVHSIPSSDHSMRVTDVENKKEADSKIFEDSRDTVSASDAAVKVETRASAKRVTVEGMCGTNAFLEALREVQAETKSEGRADSKCPEDENKSSAATTKVIFAVGISGNADGSGQTDHRRFEKESSPHSDINLKTKCEANRKQRTSSGSQKDDDFSTSDATSKIAIVDNPEKDTDEGSCKKDPSSPLATVREVDPTAEMKYETEADSSVSECPIHKSLLSPSNVYLNRAVSLEGSAQLCQQEKPEIDVSIDGRGELAVGSDPAINVESVSDCNAEIDIECSEAFISPSDSTFDISTDIKRDSEASCASPKRRNAENAFVSTSMEENAVICVEQPGQDIQMVQPSSSSDSAFLRIENSATVSHVEEGRKLCTNNDANFCTWGKEEKSAVCYTQWASVEFSEKKLALRVICSLEPRAGVQSGEDQDSQSGLDIESSVFDPSMKKIDTNRKGKAPMVYLTYPSCNVLDSGQRTNPLEEIWQKESLNPYQEKILKILSDFIESGYGAGVQPPTAVDLMTDDHEEPDIYEELSKGTVVVPSSTSKFERDSEMVCAEKFQTARWKCISKQGGIRGVTEAGSSSSSSFHSLSGICNSDSLREPTTSLYRPPPEKVHRTRSRSRSGWGGLRQF